MGNGQSEIERKRYPISLTAAQCRERCLFNADGRHCWGYKAAGGGKCWNYFEVVTELKSGRLDLIPEFGCYRKKDCNNSFGTGALMDICGVCEGNGDTCDDECGVPAGDNSTCADCAGTPNGTAEVDICGVCDGDNSGCPITSWTQLEGWCTVST